MIKKSISSISVIIAFALLLSGWLFLYNKKANETTIINDEMNLSASNTTQEITTPNDNIFKYLDKKWNDFTHLPIVKNGALRQCSSFGLTLTGCEYYRTNTFSNGFLVGGNNEIYFTIKNSNIVAAWQSTSEYDSVNELLKDYVFFKSQKPKILVENVSVRFEWTYNNNKLVVECVNNNWPSEDYYEATPIMWFEYKDCFTYIGLFSEDELHRTYEHPEPVCAFMQKFRYNISEFEYGGAHIIDGFSEGNVFFDTYCKNNLWFDFELEPPYRVLASNMGENYEEIWRYNPPDKTQSIESPDEKHDKLNCEKRTDWYDDGIFSGFVNDTIDLNDGTTWEYIGSNYSDFSVSEYDYYNFDIYEVNFSDNTKKYYLVPINTVFPAPTVYEYQSDNSIKWVWSALT